MVLFAGLSDSFCPSGPLRQFLSQRLLTRLLLRALLRCQAFMQVHFAVGLRAALAQCRNGPVMGRFCVSGGLVAGDLHQAWVLAVVSDGYLGNSTAAKGSACGVVEACQAASRRY